MKDYKIILYIASSYRCRIVHRVSTKILQPGSQFRQYNYSSISDDPILRSLRFIPLDSFWHLELPRFIHTFARRYAEVCLLLHLLLGLHALPFRVVRLSDRTLTVYRCRGRHYLDSKRTYEVRFEHRARRKRRMGKERQRGEEDTTGKRSTSTETSDARSFRRQDVRARGWYPLTLAPLKRKNFDSILSLRTFSLLLSESNAKYYFFALSRNKYKKCIVFVDRWFEFR